MKFPNYLISSLAFVGAFSLIIMACSADSTSSTNNTNAIGKYQISGDGAGSRFHVIDTETGIVKSYTSSPNTSGTVVYSLVSTTITQ